MLEQINLLGGNVIYNAIDTLNVELSIDQQIHNLDEDLLQINYGQKFLVDVGWYPSFDQNGSFCIRLIENYDWENPLFEKDAKLEQLLSILQECIDFASELQKKSYID